MLRALLDHFSHGVVEDGNLGDVALQHLEGKEVPYLDLVGNGEARPPSVKANHVIHILQLHYPATSNVGLEDDRPWDSANVRTEATWNWDQVQSAWRNGLDLLGHGSAQSW